MITLLVALTIVIRPTFKVVDRAYRYTPAPPVTACMQSCPVSYPIDINDIIQASMLDDITPTRTSTQSYPPPRTQLPDPTPTPDPKDLHAFEIVLVAVVAGIAVVITVFVLIYCRVPPTPEPPFKPINEATLIQDVDAV